MSAAIVADLGKIEQTKKKKKHSSSDSSKKKSKKSKRSGDHADAKKHKHKKRKHNHPTDETEVERQNVEEKPVEQPQKTVIENAADSIVSESDSDSEKEQEPKQNSSSNKPKANYVVTSDRILPQLHRVYDDDVDLKTKMKRRNMALGSIKVNRDYYISDSDEDSDSDDDYDSNSKYEWHQKLPHTTVYKKKVESGEWQVKTGRLTVEELIRLEKRIKKIGRRQNLSLPELRETILDDKPSNQSRFWRQVVKVFPDRSLYQISRHTRKCYHEDAYKGRWSKEEDDELLELVKLHDRRFATIAKAMGRTGQACVDRHRQLTNKSDKPRTKWTKDEFGRLEKAVNEYKEKHGKDISWDYISKKYFDGQRSAVNLRKKWDNDKQVHESAAVVVRNMKEVTIDVQLMLFERMHKMNWKSEDTINYNKLNDESFNISKETARRTYYKMRDALPGFERMKYPEIIDRLVTTRRAMVESLQD